MRRKKGRRKRRKRSSVPCSHLADIYYVLVHLSDPVVKHLEKKNVVHSFLAKLFSLCDFYYF